MIAQNLFLLINPLFAIMNLYTAYWAFQLGEVRYLLIFLSAFCLDKLFLAHRDQNQNLKTYIMTVLIDFYLLKYLFTKKYYDEQLNTSLNAKVIVSIFPLTLLNALHNFDYENMSSYLAYNLFIVQVTITITGSLLYQLSFCRNKLRLKGAVHCFLTHTSYHLSLKTMRLMYGTQGLNLDYYQIPIITLQVVIISVYMPKEKLNLILKILGVFDGILSNFQLQYNKLVKEQKDFYYYFLYNTLSYISQFLIFFIIMISVDTNNLLPDIQQDSIKQFILKTLVLLTIIFNSAFLMFGLKKIYIDIFRNKYFILYYPTDVLNASRYIYNSNKKVNKYYIFSALRYSINCSNQNYVIDQETPNENYELFLDNAVEKKCPYYALQKSISYQLKKQKTIKYDIIQTSNLSRQCCNCSIVKLFSEEQYIHKINYQHINQLRIIDLIQIYFQRYEKSFLFTEFSELVFEKLSVDFHKSLSNMKAVIFQILSFNKNIKPYMTMMPQFIMFDLFTLD
ncbi:hypothetical protein ABPG74_007235 [Tetrahymena malaccensis]